MDLATAVLPPSLLKPLPTPVSASTFKGMDEATKRTQIAAKAKEFEQSFLSIMFGQMFQGTTRTLFGGGEGEEAFTGFLTDAMAKSVEKHGGVGLAKSLSAEMLKLQGLAPKPAATAGTAASGAPSAGPAAQPPASVVPAARKPSLDIAA
jgi:Rod binding domain-containing protein